MKFLDLFFTAGIVVIAVFYLYRKFAVNCGCCCGSSTSCTGKTGLCCNKNTHSPE